MLTRRKAAYNNAVRPLPLLLLPLLLCSCAKANKTTTVAIQHATVINPGADHPVQPKATVLIQGTKVVAVGADASTPVPADAQVIDGTGKFLIPGLADLHLHLTGAGEPSGSREFFFPLLVANGVTTVRDMGGDAAMLKKLKEEIESEETLGPQIFFTGPYLDGNPPSFQPSMVIEKPSDALPAVRRLKTEGVDFIKVQSRLKPDAFFAIAEAARQQNIRFVGHVPDSISPAEAADAGQYSMEHLTGILLECSSRADELRQEQLHLPGPKETARQANARQRAWQQAVLDTYSPQKAQRLYAKLLADHTWQVPTLPLLIHLAFLTPARDLGEDANMKFVPANLRNVWEQGRAESLANKGPADFVLRDKLLEASLKSVRDMHAAGIAMVAGTDAAAPNVIPGFSLQESIADFVKAGFTPQEALQTATSKPAEFLGRTQEQGSIAAGQRADLVLLDGNPLEDIQNTRKIRAVILNGKVLDRSTLDGLLERAVKFAGRM